MPLLGQAAMVLLFDVAQEAIPEHDEWHTHEHLPERLSIPGFRRGTRWVALRGQPRYFVMYEVAQLDTLTSQPYLDRLNNPSPWTSKVMPHYRGMTRGFCSVTGSSGFGTGHVCLLIRFKPLPIAEPSLRNWLLRDRFPRLPAKPGIGSVHLLEAAVTPKMTTEQRIRGADATLDWTLFLTGYSEDALSDVLQADLRQPELEANGATGTLNAVYRSDYSLTHRELAEGATHDEP